MASVTAGKRSDAKHMCDCSAHTLYHCRILGEHVSRCVHIEKRKRASKAYMNTEAQPTNEQLDKAYGEGHNAYHDGYRLSDNPYMLRSAQGAEWRKGWNDEKNDDPYWEKIRRYSK